MLGLSSLTSTAETIEAQQISDNAKLDPSGNIVTDRSIDCIIGHPIVM
jgi:hypothetical protein